MNVNKFKHIKAALSHPLSLLLVGAIITSLVIPYFTRQWQDRQTELELKSGLADQINKAVSSTLTAELLNTNSNYNTNKTGGPQRFLNAYIDWQTSKDIIGSRLKVYFSQSQIINNWDKLASVISDLFGIVSGVRNDINYNQSMCYRLGHVLKIYAIYHEDNAINIDRSVFNKYRCNVFYIPGLEDTHQVQKYFPIKNGGVDWNALFYGFAPGNFANYYRSLILLNKDVTDHKNNLLGTIFNSTLIAFK